MANDDIKKVLITGGAGFIGSNFIDYFLAKHPEVKIINLDKLTYAGNRENLINAEKNLNYKFVEGDICDKQLVDSLMSKVDAVIHFAAESHVDNSIKDSFIFTQTNVIGTQVLLEAAKKHQEKQKLKKFLHVSTDEVYGSIKEGSFKESDPLTPSSPYAASKAAGELLASSFYRTFGLPLVVARPSNTFGPRQYPEKLIPLFITNLLENKKVPLMGKGENVRSWIYVTDTCSALDFIFQNGVSGEIYNIPGTGELKNIETTKILLSLTNKDESSIEEIPHRLGHDFRYSIDGAKLVALGWRASFLLEKAFSETVNWYKENGEWWRRLKE